MSENFIKTEFSKLPKWVQTKIQQLGITDPEEWIQKKIPALGNRSVIDTVNSSDSNQALSDYFAKVMGRF